MKTHAGIMLRCSTKHPSPKKWALRSRLSATTRTADLFGCLRRDRPETTDPTQRFPTSPEAPRHAELVGTRCAASLESFVPARSADSARAPFSSAAGFDSCDTSPEAPRHAELVGTRCAASLESFVPARTADSARAPFPSAAGFDSCETTAHHPCAKVGTCTMKVGISRQYVLARSRCAAARGSALMLMIWAILLMSVTVMGVVEYITYSAEESKQAAYEFRALSLAESGIAVGLHPSTRRGDIVMKQKVGPDSGFDVVMNYEGARIPINYITDRVLQEPGDLRRPTQRGLHPGG